MGPVSVVHANWLAAPLADQYHNRPRCDVIEGVGSRGDRIVAQLLAYYPDVHTFLAKLSRVGGEARKCIEQCPHLRVGQNLRR